MQRPDKTAFAATARSPTLSEANRKLESNNLKTWLINGALVAASLAVALILSEFALRLLGYSNPVLWTYDDVLGSRLYPGAEGWFRSEGEAYIKISGAGLRDREHAVTKPPNTLRIAVLGDSMSEALQVPEEKAFWSVLERQLKSCIAAGKQIEVINFGVSGYGTAQELLTYSHRAAQYSPDVTILAFYAGNDIRNNSRQLEPNKLRPFFKLTNDGTLVIDNAFRSDPAYVSFKSTFEFRKKFFEFRTFQLLRQLKAMVDAARENRLKGATEANLEAGSDDLVFSPPPTRDWSDGWRITERLIVALRDTVVASGGRFVAVSIPIGIQAHPDPDVRMRFMRAAELNDLWYPDKRMEALAAREGVDVITLGKNFQSYAEKTGSYLYGFENTRLGSGHLNENGHRLIGEALAQHLCRP
jgi:lysophospholipase L1-like esterase